MHAASIVVLIIWGGLAATGAWWIFAEWRRVHRIRSWPTSTGRVLEAWVTARDSSPRYNVRVEYQYKVAGKTYVGSEMTMGAGADDQEQAEGECRSYPAGLELRISYNPRRPLEGKIAELQPALDLKPILYGLAWIAWWAFLAYAATRGGVEWGSPDGW